MILLTAGESHGKAVVALLDGVTAGVPLTAEQIDLDLERRQRGYGRGGRMKIERDRAQILSGVRGGLTMGSPVAVLIENRDHGSWTRIMSEGALPPDLDAETRPRPGHGDLAGMLKYATMDARDILERASARETAARVAAGAVARRLLDELGITVRSRVLQVGGARTPPGESPGESEFDCADRDPMGCSDPDASERMVAEVDRAAEEGCSLGGVFEVVATGVMPGLGSHSQADRRLDGRLFAALGSIPGVKGVEAGEGFALAGRDGTEAHDEIFFDGENGLHRKTNRAGGLEAGMTNGEPLVLRAAMKPIPTLARPLATVDLESLEPAGAFRERADVCAVPAASVVAEAVVCLVLADAAQEKFGGDTLSEMKHNLMWYLERIGRFWHPRQGIQG